MEEEYNGGFQSDGSAEARSIIFSKLKHYCLELLGLIQSPKKNSSTLPQLLRFLRHSSPHDLQPFFDYTLFPLLLLLDASVNSRSPPKVDSEEKSVMFDFQKAPDKVSDAVAEGVLHCLEDLLNKCHLGSVEQMVLMLKKLSYAAMLSPSEASEEFREGVIRCFRALLLRLNFCSDNSCSCKEAKPLPILLASKDLLSSVDRFSIYESEPEECLLSFLQSQAASAAIGHWLSLLLKAADAEVARGHRGSANLRVEAFMALRILVAKVGVADVLAFFLPGVVSQIGKVLNVSKTMISGAAGSAEATDQAIRGLAEFLMIVLEDDSNLSCLDVDGMTGLCLNNEQSSQSFLKELRNLPVRTKDQSKIIAEEPTGQVPSKENPSSSYQERNSVNSGSMIPSLHVNRTRDWIVETSAHVDRLLRATFSDLCIHSAVKVRLGILAAIEGLLWKCGYTLRQSRLMLLECLCVLVCDDSEEVSSAAQAFFHCLLLSSSKRHIEHDITEIFSRLVEKLPKAVLGSEESLALSHAQKLLVVIYFSGPQLVADYLLQSPVTAARFLDVFALCLSQNSLFSGSLNKLTLGKSSSTGYLHSIAEMKARICFINDNPSIEDGDSIISKFPTIRSKRLMNPMENVQYEYDLPRMPPWFSYVGSQKLYQALAGILRLVGLSLFSDSRSKGLLSVIIDIPLGYLRKLVSDLRKKGYDKENWTSWYWRNGSGQLVRQSSTAVCIINEMIYGVSNQAVDAFSRMFPKPRCAESKVYGGVCHDATDCELLKAVPDESVWRDCLEKGTRSHLIDCVGSILHEYLSNEVWDLPLEQNSSIQQSQNGVENVTFHFFHDNAMLHQVIIDGVGIFSLCLGSEFSSCGFLHSPLYVLLENLICSNFQIRSASDAVLHIISTVSGYPSVGNLILGNADYVIDSICQQLRHLNLNPHVPNVLAAMLSYIGVAHKILPLLEEPMRSVALELEILGRHQHPDLTIAFLKAVAEIAKTCKKEAQSLPNQAESYLRHVESKMFSVEKKTLENADNSSLHYCNGKDMDATSERMVGAFSDDIDSQIEQWESTLFELNDSKRYRQAVGSISSSCITAAIPLLASAKEAASLVALDIIEDGIVALAKVEEAYKHEKETKETIEQALQLCSFHHLRDSMEAAEDETIENRLLPTMNHIWPFLVACVQNKNPVAVRRCSDVISSVVQICGGDFFSRRFVTDGINFWKLLSTSPFQRGLLSKEERSGLQLPYRSTSVSLESSMAETSHLKVQAAILNMIANLSQHKQSASALEGVLKKVSGLVVGIACSGIVGLRDASVNALVGLVSIDPDLIWLLLADVYYSLKQKDAPLPPSPCFPEISQVLPPTLSPKGYLYMQYGGQSFGFEIDISSVETVAKKLHYKVFFSQVYS